MRRAILAGMIAAVAIFCCAGTAGAVDLPRNQASFSSAQVVDGKLIWFQRNDRKIHSNHGQELYREGVGALYARALDSKTAERVYLPPKGQRIVAFKAAAGRIAIGLATIAKGDHGPTSVAELTPGPVPWKASTLSTASDAVDAKSCGSRVGLLAIRANSDLLVQSTTLEPRGKDCILSRQVAQLQAIPKSGPVVELASRKSGWSNEKLWNTLPALFPVNGDWLPQMRGGYFGAQSPISVWNFVTGERKLFSSEFGESRRTEATTGGGLLLRNWDDEYKFLPNLSEPNAVSTLKRQGSSVWIHACGSSLLEISRPRKSGFSGKWKIYIRDANGKTQRKLKAKLNAGTMFDACDQNTAVFHRWRHDGGAHQWAVSLAP